MNNNSAQGIAWMCAVVVVVLALMSPTQQESFDQPARNIAGVVSLRVEVVESATRPLNDRVSNSLAPLTKLLKKQQSQPRKPSSMY